MGQLSTRGGLHPAKSAARSIRAINVDTIQKEHMKMKADDVGWFASRRSRALFLSVLTLGEIRKGVENVPDSERRLKLLDWLEIELSAYFSGRIPSVDALVADRWGRLQAEAKRPLSAVDSLLAATALHHQLRLVTRNEKRLRLSRSGGY